MARLIELDSTQWMGGKGLGGYNLGVRDGYKEGFNWSCGRFGRNQESLGGLVHPR